MTEKPKKLRAIGGGKYPKTVADAKKAQVNHHDPSINWVRFEDGQTLSPAPCEIVRESLLRNGFAEEVK